MTIFTSPLPAESHGFVVGRYVLIVGDTVASPDPYPDAAPAVGKITFRPVVKSLHSTDPDEGHGVAITAQPLSFELDYDGYIKDARGSRGVWVIAGAYDVSFQLEGVSVAPFRVLVTPEHTEASPLDLTLETPLPEDPTIKWVVNEQVYLETLAARDEVLQALNAVSTGIVTAATDPNDPESVMLTFPLFMLDPNEPSALVLPIGP